MTTTAHAQSEATAQEFLDKFEHADATERQTILILIKGLAEGVAWADAYNQIVASLASIALPVTFFLCSQSS
jgi:hypothetical protein